MDVTIRVDHYHHFVGKREDALLKEILASVKGLDQHLMTQDESIAAFKASADAQFAAMDANFANILADETNILDQLKTISGLSPANQAILDGALVNLKARVDKSKAIADNVPDTTVEP